MSGRALLEITESDFATLLEVLSETAKGRAFLGEYRRRSGPEETETLLAALRRIETAVGTIRDRLHPASIAEELRRISMTLQVALEGARAGAREKEWEQRLALVERARSELAKLAAGLAGEIAPAPGERAADQAAAETTLPSPER